MRKLAAAVENGSRSFYEPDSNVVAPAACRHGSCWVLGGFVDFESDVVFIGAEREADEVLRTDIIPMLILLSDKLVAVVSVFISNHLLVIV